MFQQEEQVILHAVAHNWFKEFFYGQETKWSIGEKELIVYVFIFLCIIIQS